MANYIQFKVGKPGKYDGKVYKRGEIFPYDPDNPNHVRAYELGNLTAHKANQRKQAKKGA